MLTGSLHKHAFFVLVDNDKNFLHGILGHLCDQFNIGFSVNAPYLAIFLKVSRYMAYSTLTGRLGGNEDFQS